LIRVNEVGHLAAENVAVLDHGSANTALRTSDSIKSFVLFDLLLCFHHFWEVFGVLICQPLHQELAAFKFLVAHNCLHEPGKILLPLFDALV